MDVKWKEAEVQPFIYRMFPTFHNIICSSWNIDLYMKSIKSSACISNQCFQTSIPKIYVWRPKIYKPSWSSHLYNIHEDMLKKIALCSYTAPWGFLWSASFDTISISFGGSLRFFPSAPTGRRPPLLGSYGIPLWVITGEPRCHAKYPFLPTEKKCQGSEKFGEYSSLPHMEDWMVWV